MDDVQYSSEKYNEVMKEVFGFFQDAGFTNDQIHKNVIFIPISAFKGHNLIKSGHKSKFSFYSPEDFSLEKTDELEFYKGPSLLEAIENLEP